MPTLIIDKRFHWYNRKWKKEKTSGFLGMLRTLGARKMLAGKGVIWAGDGAIMDPKGQGTIRAGQTF